MNELSTDPSEETIQIGDQHIPIEKIRKGVEGASKWFLLIAGVTLFNTISSIAQWNFKLIFGLAVTQVGREILSLAIAPNNPETQILVNAIDLCITLVFVGLFIFLWRTAASAKVRAFEIGMALYFCDMFFFAYLQEWKNAGFHLLALFMLFFGLASARSLADHAKKSAPTS